MLGTAVGRLSYTDCVNDALDLESDLLGGGLRLFRTHYKECYGFHGISYTDTATKIQYPPLQQTATCRLVSRTLTLGLRRVEANTLD